MARGWESKAVESQLEDRERRVNAVRQRPLTAAERDLVERQRTLELTRSRLRADLDASTAPAHRQMLERALEAIEREIAALQAGPGGNV